MLQNRQQILTGDRPTGCLHLGHYAGSLQQRVVLQNEYSQTILIADLQALTDNGFNPGKVSENVLNLVADYLAVGIDPRKSTICLQSALPALSELTMYYLNLVSVSRLYRNPTVKNEIESKSFGGSVPAGFLTYPVSQAADITAFKGELVPVGDDQLPMIEQTNEIVRKVNRICGKAILLESKPLLSNVPRLKAPDGKNKMSKSMNNCIFLGADEKSISAAVKSMYTDPLHIRVEDPGCIEGNIVFEYLDVFHPDKQLVFRLKEQYQTGGLADSKVKNILNECLQELIKPIRIKRDELINDKAELLSILGQGTAKANEITYKTLSEVKQGFGLMNV
ncbi:tryptophan--tRNA ligase [Marinobacter adhaerens]|uniref:Tryptophan--tRNA ligase n=1 Tax=Marinobacter adhaerens TaxID=1033846 RepID=A0A851HNI5_9GAMM|nr:tryptophan--tRNA ligase [Marinobacter adhaerens]NWN90310.1 tryptophan--tRNA ligase [Marinobacter adhaerens]